MPYLLLYTSPTVEYFFLPPGSVRSHLIVHDNGYSGLNLRLRLQFCRLYFLLQIVACLHEHCCCELVSMTTTVHFQNWEALLLPWDNSRVYAAMRLMINCYHGK